MKQYDAKKILNIALAGHSGSGKTSVAESILYLSKMSERLGKVADGNTVLDFDSEEIKRQTSIMTAVAPIEWKNTKINLIDTPGLFDFAGGVAEGMRAADTALIVVCMLVIGIVSMLLSTILSKLEGVLCPWQFSKTK